MSAVWPVTLPSSPLINGYDFEVADTTIRSQPDWGPAKVRLRFTAGVDKVVWPVMLDLTQWATLASFYKNDCGRGSVPFTGLSEPLTGDALTLRFTAPPKPQPQSADRVLCSLEFESLPAGSV